ncbi:hypothetical protein N0V94_006892 [Neodidymelliopsis sp. IMI 364377]|nr:hypothetical protein N0V94_006892 [Neodidymelliopsis sp. IMI 364377]
MPWSKTSDAFWVANALFVSCLLCAIWAIISTIQAKSILDDLPDKEDINVSLADLELKRIQLIGIFGLATYVFTAIFVYMSEKDLEHHVTGAYKESDRETGDSNYVPTSPPELPSLSRKSGSINGSVSFEQFQKDGFIEIDLENQTGRETITIVGSHESKSRKKTRLILFN